jgi:uncharacterized protein YjbI with pentapeptide repeats
MANIKQRALLKSGVEAWNRWRAANPEVRPDLAEADLECESLDRVDLHDTDLTRANLTHAFFHDANLCGADLTAATVVGTNFCRARLRGAKLIKADLHRANFDRADLTDADLSDANLERTMLVGTIVANAIFSRCRVYGTSAWDLDLREVKDQTDLRITREDQQETITVANLQVAQFVYLLLHNKTIRDVIETVSNKGVLLIGRLTGPGGELLRAIRDKLTTAPYGLVPIMFEFAPVPAQETARTLLTLAHLCRFVIADLTDAQSVLQELTAISKDLPTLPVRPLLQEKALMPPMADSFLVLESVIKPVYRYSDKESLLEDLARSVIDPAEARARKVEADLAEIRRLYLPWQNRDAARPAPQT